MKNSKKDYLKVVVGSRGEVEDVSWIRDKSFEEIREIGREIFDKNIKENLEGQDKYYIDEFCNWFENCEKGVEFSLDEETSVGFYVENIVKELKDIDFTINKSWDIIDKVFWKVGGCCQIN